MVVLGIPSTILGLDFRTSALDYRFIRFEEQVKEKREVRIDDFAFSSVRVLECVHGNRKKRSAESYRGVSR